MQNDKIQSVLGLVAQRGGWPSILANWEGLNQALQRGTRQQPCPLTGKGKTKFRFFRDYQEKGGAYHNDVGALPGGIDVIAWYTGKTKGEVLNDIIDLCGGKNVLDSVKPMPKPEPVEFCSKSEAEKRSKRISKAWKESEPLVGSLAETYLRSRGIKSDLSYLGNNLRFHPSMPYKEDDKSPWQRLPCMLAVYRDSEGKPLTLHRTFLKPDGSGKADVSRPKMVMAPPRDMRGGYIVLDKPVKAQSSFFAIGVSEGIENALSVREGMGVPMFVGYSDRLMEMMILPNEVQHVFMFADIEPSGAGMRSVAGFKEANKQRDVLILKPDSDKAKVDWNDEYREKGYEAFPQLMKPAFRPPGVVLPEDNL